MSSDGIQSTFSNVLLYLQVCLGIWQFIKLTPVGALIKGVFGWLLRPLGLSTTYSRLQDCPGLDGRVFKRANCFELQPDIPAERRGIQRDQDNSINLNYLGSNFVLERKKEKEEDGDTLYVGPKIKYYITEMIWKELQNLEQVLRYGQDGPPFARAAVTKAAAVRLEAQYEDAKVEAQRADAEAQRADAEAQRADAVAQRADAEAQRADAEGQRAEAQLVDVEAQRADVEAQQPFKWDSAYYNVTYGVPAEAATDARAAAANYALTADDYVGPSATDTESARRMAAESARRMAAEFARRKAAESARRMAAESARRKAAESARRKAAEFARPMAAEFARRKAAESVEARRKAVASVEARLKAAESVEARRKAAESARITADSVHNAAASRATLFVKGRKDFWKGRITGGVMTFVEVMDAIILYNQHVSVCLSHDLLLPINLSVSEERLLKIINLVALFLQTKKVVKVHWSIPTALSLISALLEFSTTIRARLYSQINVFFCSIMHPMCDPLPRSWRRQVYSLGKWVENLTPCNDIQLKVVRGDMCAIITEGAKVDKEGAILERWFQGPFRSLYGLIEEKFPCAPIGSNIKCTFVIEHELCEISAPDITDTSEFHVKCKDEDEFRRIITLVKLMSEKCCGSLISYGPNNKVRVRGFKQSVTSFVDNGFPSVYTLDLANVIVA